MTESPQRRSPEDEQRYAKLSPILEIDFPGSKDRREIVDTMSPFRDNVRLQLGNYLDAMTPYLGEQVDLEQSEEMKKMGRVGRVIRLSYPYRVTPQQYIPKTKEIHSTDTQVTESVTDVLDNELNPPFVMKEPNLVTMLEKKLSSSSETDEALQATREEFWTSVGLFDESATAIENISGNRVKTAIGKLTTALEQVYGSEKPLPKFVILDDARRVYISQENRFVTDPQFDRSDPSNVIIISGSGEDVPITDWYNFGGSVVDALTESVAPKLDKIFINSEMHKKGK